MRLQKYMAYCGVASRRKCEEIISEGRVSINGHKVMDMGIKINPDCDVVSVDGRVLELNKRPSIYIMINKPRGYITSSNDQFGRSTVLDLIPDMKARLYPVGRLDYDSEGLLLLTNDGSLTYKLTHPKYHVEKEYYVEVIGFPNEEHIEKLRNGLDIGGYKTRSAKVYAGNKTKNGMSYRIVIKEGKNRQVRRMFEAIGYHVILLRRERMGLLSLGDLKPGNWRYLSNREISLLKQSVKEGY
ncbi:MAG: rRNA pseudouridine synthase [Xylanivirga thermophila]|jgi:23S rRNA pseudouridine2605 synthase|uniref:pseudouridine synthase n=1 Tax=Xylanivirga thermophila TaxID=2496273 RepID=UPI00101BFAC7|nr:pseudouridine synthase [Xylanivirga thermophila]